MMNEPETSDLINLAERHLRCTEVYKGCEIAVYESESELWNGAILADKGHSAEAAVYQQCFDDDAGWMAVMVGSHAFFPVEPGMTHADALAEAIEHVDLHEEKGA